jgi:Uma2 family endonuclease
VTIAALMTAEDLLKLPPDNMRHELVQGELTTMAPTSDEHGARTGRITLRIGDYVERNDLGVFFGAETGFVIRRNPDTVRAPDFAFVSKARMATQGLTRKFFPGAPDLAVEVLSPSDSASEMLEKIDEWLAAGTRLVWVVDPAKKTVAVYAPNRQPRILKVAEQIEGEEVLPGFKLAVGEIFR